LASTLTNLLAHIVFSTKNREQLISPEFQEELYAYIGGIIRSENGKLLAIGGMPDHLHLLVMYRPSQALADIVRALKASSSKWIDDRGFIDSPFAWQSGYGAFSVSESKTDLLKAYINKQVEHHNRKSFEGELTELLRLHNVKYDPQHLWT
jgi:REP element-mobilizing transposase RayT